MKNKWLKAGNKGFSLVELIVVIAIMAILVGVAVPVYTGYIEKSQKAADVQLIDEIKHAMEIANAAQTLTESAYVKIGADGVVEVGPKDSEAAKQLETVLKATFGDDLSGLKLKYDGWKGASPSSYANTSYYGNESSLLTEVDRLTNALGTAVKDYNIDLGTAGTEGTFADTLEQYGLSRGSDAHAIGNAAVLYVANKTAAESAFVTSTFTTTLANQNTFVNETFNTLSPRIGDAAALAAIYAYAEGFAQYCEKQNAELGAVDTFHNAADFDGVQDANQALARLETAFNALGAVGNEYIPTYMSVTGPGVEDLGGYLDIMNTVNNNKAIVEGNLTAEDCFTDGTVEDMLDGYAAMAKLGVTTQNGEIAVAFVISDNKTGTFVIPVSINE